MINRTLDIGRDIFLLFVDCSTFSSMFFSDMFCSVSSRVTEVNLQAFKETSLDDGHMGIVVLRIDL